MDAEWRLGDGHGSGGVRRAGGSIELSQRELRCWNVDAPSRQKY